jgi:hypothetical protein
VYESTKVQSGCIFTCPLCICKAVLCSGVGGCTAAGHRRTLPAPLTRVRARGVSVWRGCGGRVSSYTHPTHLRARGVSGVRWQPDVVVYTLHTFASVRGGVVRWPGIVVYTPHAFASTRGLAWRGVAAGRRCIHPPLLRAQGVVGGRVQQIKGLACVARRLISLLSASIAQKVLSYHVIERGLHRIPTLSK